MSKWTIELRIDKDGLHWQNPQNPIIVKNMDEISWSFVPGGPQRGYYAIYLGWNSPVDFIEPGSKEYLIKEAQLNETIKCHIIPEAIPNRYKYTIVVFLFDEMGGRKIFVEDPEFIVRRG